MVAATVNGFFTTTFSGSGNLVSVQPGWQGGASAGLDWTDPTLSSGVAYSSQTSSPRAPPFDDSIALRIGETYTADQYSEITIARNSPSGEHEVECFTRGTMSAHSMTGYETDIIMDSGVILVSWQGAINNYVPLTTTITTNCTWNNGDKYRTSWVGSNCTVTCNGNTVLTISDTQWASGKPGMGLWVDLGSSAPGFGISAFTASNIP